MASKTYLLGLFLLLFLAPSVHSAGCNFSGAVTYDNVEGIYFFNSWFFYDTVNETENLSLTLFNQKENLIIFSDQPMLRAFRGNFVYSKELFLEDGIYSYTLTSFARDCSRTFFFEVSNASTVSNYAVPENDLNNTNQNWWVWPVIGIVVLLGVVWYIKKK